MEALLVKRRTQGRQCRPQTRDMPMPKPIAHPDACTSKYMSTYVHIQFDCEIPRGGYPKPAFMENACSSAGVGGGRGGKMAQ